MKTINARDYVTREELEAYVNGTIGLTTDDKPDVKIKGSRDELKRLRLSDRTKFWGIVCEITDKPTQFKKQTERPDRGPTTKEFGINLEQ